MVEVCLNKEMYFVVVVCVSDSESPGCHEDNAMPDFHHVNNILILHKCIHTRLSTANI